MKTFDYTFPPGSWRGEDKTVKARRIVPGLIVTTNTAGSMKWFRVTHELSGYNSARDFDTLKDATAVAEALNFILDWNRPLAELNRDFENADLRRIVRRVATAQRY